MTGEIVVTLPLRLVSLANRREHWAQRSGRAKLQRKTASWALRMFTVPEPQPLDIEITRIAPRPLDSDNLAISAKHVRDGVADWLGIDDGHPLLLWAYSQERGSPHHYSCRVRIRPKED